MKLIVDQGHPGTREKIWQESRRLDALPNLHVTGFGKVILFLLIPMADPRLRWPPARTHSCQCGYRTDAVTEGEGSHLYLDSEQSRDLVARRQNESRPGQHRPGLERPKVTRFGIADGRVVDRQEMVGNALAIRVQPTDLVVAPRCADGHPDQGACGRSAANAASDVKARLIGYLTWAWHWASPLGGDIRWR